MVVTEERLEQALTFIAESDLNFANLKANVLRTEFKAKAAEALVYKSLEGSIEDKRQQTRLAPEVSAAWEQHFKSVVDFETLKARRERNFIVIELFRTFSANLRKGQV